MSARKTLLGITFSIATIASAITMAAHQYFPPQRTRGCALQDGINLTIGTLELIGQAYSRKPKPTTQSAYTFSTNVGNEEPRMP